MTIDTSYSLLHTSKQNLVSYSMLSLLSLFSLASNQAAEIKNTQTRWYMAPLCSTLLIKIRHRPLIQSDPF